MSSSDESKANSVAQEDFTPLHELAQTVVETFQESYKDVTDPFEYYAYSVRSHIYSSNPTYASRFAAGYQILLDEINPEKKSS